MTEPKQLTAVVIAKSDALNDQVALTPGTLPDLAITVLTPLRSLVVRTVRAYLQFLSGMLTLAGLGAVGALPKVLIPSDFWQAVITCAYAALCPTFLCFLQNAIELAAKWDETNPNLRG